MKELITAFVAARAAFPPIPQDGEAKIFSKRTNKEFSYRYTTMGKLLELTVPPLTANGLIIVQPTRITEAGSTIISTELWHTSGDVMKSELILPSASDPKEFGGLISFYRRYSYASLLCLAGEEDKDAERFTRDNYSVNTEVNTPRTRGGEGRSTNQRSEQNKGAITQDPKKVTPAQISLLSAKCREFEVSMEDLKALVLVKCGVTSRKDIPKSQFDALLQDILQWQDIKDEILLRYHAEQALIVAEQELAAVSN